MRAGIFRFLILQQVICASPWGASGPGTSSCIVSSRAGQSHLDAAPAQPRQGLFFDMTGPDG
jgi:hypothetical protein